MSNTQTTSSSHGKLIVVVVAAALVVVLALLSAFVWPGWALNKDAGTGEQTQQSEQSQNVEEEPTTPSIDAVALPEDATELLKAMPDSVLNYARTAAEASTAWDDGTPLEQYVVTYSTGDEAKDVSLTVAQWSTSDSAKAQYDKLAGALTGEELGSGTVKVSGDATGSYTAKVDASDDTKAVALWQNDTVVFQATGQKAAVERFYKEFPL